METRVFPKKVSMPDKTDYLGLQLWDDSEEGWEHRSDFKTLDTRAVDHGSIDNRPDTAPPGALYLATDCNILYQWANSEGWIERAGVGTADWALTEQHVGLLRTDKIHTNDNIGEVFAREFNGTDLAAKVQNTLDYLKAEYGGAGRVRVTGRDDGQPWQWDQDLTLNAMNYGGIDIDIDMNVTIEYTGDGTALTLAGADKNQNYRPIRLRGGRWEATGNPDRWLRTRDLIFSKISPQFVEFSNSSNDAEGISVEHYYIWSENSDFSGRLDCDIGIEFRHGNHLDDAPSTSNSFHGTSLTNLFINASNTGIHLRGKWDYCTVTNLQLWAKDDGVDLMILDSERMEGTTFQTVKFEDPGTVEEDITGIILASNYNGYYGPLFISPKFGSGIDTNVRDIGNATNPTVVGMDTVGTQLRVRDLRTGNGVSLDGGTVEANSIDLENFTLSGDAGGYHTKLEHNEEGDIIVRRQGEDLVTADEDRVEVHKPLALPIDDVRNISSPAQGYVAYHEPSVNSDSNTEGPAFYDGTDWVSQVDGSTID